jgi:DNA-directed RNA polymerase specialized sigma24 family protein
VEDTGKLVQRILAGDLEAWPVLQQCLEPEIMNIARRHPSMRRKGLAGLPDDLAEIRTAALERLCAGQFNNLRQFSERSALSASQGGETFDAWLYGLVDFTVREHVRKRYGRAPKAQPDSAQAPQPSKRDLQSHAGRLDEQLERSLLASLSVTTRLTLAEIFAYIANDFTEDEARAVRLYFLEDRSFEDIARTLNLADAKTAERLVRRLNARLRYRFVGDSQ